MTPPVFGCVLPLIITYLLPPETVYDLLYRLLSADGREHRGQTANNQPQDRPELKPHYDFNDSTRMKLAHPNDGQAMRHYSEEYHYDPVGNILAMIHTADAGNWTRHYDYAVDSNRLRTTNIPGDGNDSQVNVKNLPDRYTYDAHGNMTQMPHLPLMQWDFRDQLQASSQQVRTDGGTPEITYYVYGASGQRVRKVTERQADTGKTPTRSKERIYLGGFEIYREFGGDNTTITLERETLHIMDDKRRIALVETKTIEAQNGIGGAINNPTPIIRYQLDNHLGSASLELDKDGQILSYEEYHPYGTTSYQAKRSVAEVSLKRYRYTDKERDEETGLYYHGKRYYAPWLGRWTSCDPTGMADGVDLYVYSQDRPPVLTDRSGTESKPAWDRLQTEDSSANYYVRSDTEFSSTQVYARETANFKEAWAQKDNRAGNQEVEFADDPITVERFTPEKMIKDFTNLSDNKFVEKYGSNTYWQIYNALPLPPPLTLPPEDKTIYMGAGGRVGTAESLFEGEVAEVGQGSSALGGLYSMVAVILGADAKEAARMGNIGNQVAPYLSMAAIGAAAIGRQRPPSEEKFEVSHDPAFYAGDEQTVNREEIISDLTDPRPFTRNYRLIDDIDVVYAGEGIPLDRLARHAHDPTKRGVFRGMQIISDPYSKPQGLKLEEDKLLEEPYILNNEPGSFYKLAGPGYSSIDVARSLELEPKYTLLNPFLYPSARKK